MELVINGHKNVRAFVWGWGFRLEAGQFRNDKVSGFQGLGDIRVSGSGFRAPPFDPLYGFLALHRSFWAYMGYTSLRVRGLGCYQVSDDLHFFCKVVC